MREKLLCRFLALDVPATTLPITHAPENGAGSPLSCSLVALLVVIIITVAAAIILLVLLTKKNRRGT